MIVIRKRPQERQSSEPSPARIEERASEIRQNWSRRQTLRRAQQAPYVELVECSVMLRWNRSFNDE